MSSSSLSALSSSSVSAHRLVAALHRDLASEKNSECHSLFPYVHQSLEFNFDVSVERLQFLTRTSKCNISFEHYDKNSFDVRFSCISPSKSNSTFSYKGIWSFFIFSLPPVSPWARLSAAHFRADWLPMIGARQPSGTQQLITSNCCFSKSEKFRVLLFYFCHIAD